MLPRHRHLLFVVAAVLLAFGGGLDGGFFLDDYRHIVENPRIRSLDPWWGPLLGTTRPLVQWSMALNFAMSGLHPWSYHVVNIALHLGAALSLFGVLRLTLARLPSTRDAAAGLAATGSALWAVHPLQTESVTYLIQRAEAGMGFCVLLTLLAFARAAAAERENRAWLALGVAACLAGYGFKPIMAVTPLLVLFYDRCFVSGSFATALRARPWFYALLAATPAVLPLLLAGNRVEWADSAGFGTREVQWWQYAATQPEVLLHYLRLSAWPAPLCLDYGWPIERSGGVIALTAGAVLALVALTVIALRRWPACGFLGAWFFLNLAPTSSFIPLSDIAFEHRMYLALAALTAGAVVAGHAALARAPRLRPVFGVAAVIVFAGVTIVRNADYASPLRLWAKNAAAAPENPRAHQNLGREFGMIGQAERAIAHFQRAVELRPGYAIAWRNLGRAQWESGDRPAALASYRRCVELREDDAESHLALGSALAQTGDVKGARTHFERAATLRPRDAAIRLTLARALRTLGLDEEARIESEHALVFARENRQPALAAEIERRLEGMTNVQ